MQVSDSGPFEMSLIQSLQQQFPPQPQQNNSIFQNQNNVADTVVPDSLQEESASKSDDSSNSDSDYQESDDEDDEEEDEEQEVWKPRDKKKQKISSTPQSQHKTNRNRNGSSSINHSESEPNPVKGKRGRKPIDRGNSSNTCQTCGKSFTAFSSLQRHEITHQANPKRFVCDVCEEKFTQKPSLIEHKKRKHFGEFDFPCPHCEKKFILKRDLLSHMKVHAKAEGIELEKFACRVCGQTFPRKSACTRHEKVHNNSDSNRISCDKCDRTYSNINTFKWHESIFHGIKRPRYPENDERVPCPHCPITVRRAEYLKYHIRKVHLDVRRTPTHKSKYCEQMFASRSERDLHEARHEFRLPKVWNCKVFFERARSRKRFRCGLCPAFPPADFPTSYLRDQHKKTVHPELQLVLKKITGINISLNPDDPSLLELADENGREIDLDLRWNLCLKCGRAYQDLNSAIRHNNFCTAIPKPIKRPQPSPSKEVQSDQTTDESEDEENFSSTSSSADEEFVGSSDSDYGDDSHQIRPARRVHQRNLRSHKIPIIPKDDEVEVEFEVPKQEASQEIIETPQASDEGDGERSTEEEQASSSAPVFNIADSPSNSIEMEFPSPGTSSSEKEREQDPEPEPQSPCSSIEFSPPGPETHEPVLKSQIQLELENQVEIRNEDTRNYVDMDVDEDDPLLLDTSAVPEDEDSATGPSMESTVPTLAKAKRPICDLLACVTPYEKEHINIILTAEKPFQCKTCLKFYTTKSLCKAHIRAQHGKPKYQCEYCGKNFSQKNNIDIHIRVQHTGEKPYHCDSCEFRTAYPGSFHAHKRTHTGEKPYVCKVCDYRTGHPAGFFNHKKTHQLVNVTCTFCNKTFKNLKHFKEHMNAKHTHKNEDGSFKIVQPYSCTICGVKFSYTASAHLHIRKQHKSQVEAQRKDRPEERPPNSVGKGVMAFCYVDKNLITPPEEKSGRGRRKQVESSNDND